MAKTTRYTWTCDCGCGESCEWQDGQERPIGWLHIGIAGGTGIINSARTEWLLAGWDHVARLAAKQEAMRVKWGSHST